jgi:hypothetical protein
MMDGRAMGGKEVIYLVACHKFLIYGFPRSLTSGRLPVPRRPLHCVKGSKGKIKER